ncbi:MAG TPA: hypothetical protein PLH86_08870 [Saprospiraceae bacterium]|jgi:hypothetical protein|nr:hypothetical protein [Saprospiraceae bacterium]
MENKPHKSENIHIILWLIKDMSWLMSWKLLGLAMVIPTIIVSIIIAKNSRNIQEDMWYNIAVCFWISANGTWMIGEFFFKDSWRMIALGFFSMGAITILYYHIVIKKYSKKSD